MIRKLTNRVNKLEKQLNHNTNQIIDITKQAEAIRKYLQDDVAYENAGFQEVKRERTPAQEEYSKRIFDKYLGKLKEND